ANDLSTLVTELERLVASLDHLPEPAVVRAGDLPFLARRHAVAGLHDGLRQEFADACERLLGGEKYGPGQLLEAGPIPVLAPLSTGTWETGLSPLEQRKRIQVLYSQACRDLHHVSLQNLTNPADAGGAGAAPADAPASAPATRPAGSNFAALLGPIAAAA